MSDRTGRLLTGLLVCSLLGAAGGIPAATAAGAGADPGAGVTIARLRYGGGGDWYGDQSSLPNWLQAVRERTGIATAEQPVTVTLEGEDLYRYPLLFACGHGRIALSDREARILRRYLEDGGFLYVDDDYGLDASFRQTMRQVFPDIPLVPIGSEHPIYHCWYDLPGLPKVHEHDGDPAQAFGIFQDGRLLVYYTWSSDIGDGLEDPDVHGDPPEIREAAVRMAVNILVYALTHP